MAGAQEVLYHAGMTRTRALWLSAFGLVGLAAILAAPVFCRLGPQPMSLQEYAERYCQEEPPGSPPEGTRVVQTFAEWADVLRRIIDREESVEPPPELHAYWEAQLALTRAWLALVEQRGQTQIIGSDSPIELLLHPTMAGYHDRIAEAQAQVNPTTRETLVGFGCTRWAD